MNPVASPVAWIRAGTMSFPRDRARKLWQGGRVTTTEAMRLLEKFRAGGISRDKVLQAFQAAPVADLGFAQVDTHRALRKGFPEIIFGAGKTPEQVLKIASRLLDQDRKSTRLNSSHVRI